ncbi:MAG: DUF2066 domain-containing protein [Proteobacteria bacterium]|nr:DUF2066 domain-containing protein [Pseudomonadota bacterium]
MIATHWKYSIFAIALGLAPILAGAEAVYTGSAPVATQSDQDRAMAVRAALGQAITQAAKGDASVLKRPEVARALTRAERYVRSYRYQADVPAGEAKKPGTKFQFVAQFDAGQIDALVREQAATPAPSVSAPGDTAPANPGTVASAPTGVPSPAVPADVAPSPGVASSYRIWFSGLRSATDYARLVGALGTLPDVRALSVEQAHGNVLQVRIEVRGTLQSLAESLAATHLAQATNTEPPVAGVDAIFDLQP